MSKPKVKVEGNTISGTAEAIGDLLAKAIPKPYEITSASIKESLCNYGYEIKTGPTAGDKIPTRKGSAIIHEDMNKAFEALNVHLAIIDDAFRYVFKELPALGDLQAHDIRGGFTVTGFKINGSEEDEGFVLLGDKWVTYGIMASDTPKISKSSGYKFFNELKEAVENARTEVELYMNGKAAPKDDEEDKNQLKLPFSAGEFDAEE